jgi:3-oxoacyl-[acyl-carrier protein] reductase
MILVRVIHGELLKRIIHMQQRKNTDQLFIVCGATSGFGNAVAKKLLNNNYRIIAVARKEKDLEKLRKQYPEKMTYVAGDLSDSTTSDSILNKVDGQFLAGLFVNSGGPPAKSIEETVLDDWDDAYNSLLRWKIELTKRLLPTFKKQQYGRILFLESASVKQPIENLVLSTSLRLAVVGYAKTLSEEMAHNGITVNILAPGYHDTQALNRLLEKKSHNEGISINEARNRMKKQTKVGSLGNPSDLASLAGWLLSEESGYITGQTISVDGGVIKGIFG